MFVYYFRERFYQNPAYHTPQLSRNKLLVAARNVITVKKNGNNRRIRRRTSNSLFFKSPDDRGICIARRSLRKMLLRIEFIRRNFLACFQGRKISSLVFLGRKKLYDTVKAFFRNFACTYAEYCITGCNFCACSHCFCIIHLA